MADSLVAAVDALEELLKRAERHGMALLSQVPAHDFALARQMLAACV